MTRKLAILAPTLALAALCAMLLSPLATGIMPETADGTLHLYRAITLQHALSEGQLWARYVPGMVYGYGSPLFNYYSPLSLYPNLLLTLAGLTPVQAWLFSMALWTLAAAGGLYALARRWMPPAGALVAAAAYAAAPYTLYDVLWRGTVSEIASLAVLPWLMSAMHALAQRPSRWRFALVAVWVALFMPMHNVITLHGAALLAAFGVLLAFTHPDRWRTLWRIGLAGALGAALCAFFWMPAITETGLVKIDGVTANLPEIDVTRNLAPLSEAFAIPSPADPTRQQPPAAIALGWPALLLGAVGLAGLWRTGQRALSAFCLGGIALLLFMNTPASAPVWRAIPLIQYSQFPTRLIGPASLLLAILAGAGAHTLLTSTRTTLWRSVLYTVMLGAILTYAIPYLYRIPLPNLDPRTITDAQDFERLSGYIGTSSFGEYVPRWAETLPDPNALTDRFAQSTIIPRLIAPPSIQIEAADWGLTHANLTLSANQPTSLTFDWFYLPQWQVTLNGQPIPTYPTPSTGLLGIDIPAGTHQLSIQLGQTTIQNTATLISFGALIMLGVLIWVWPRLSVIFGQVTANTPRTQHLAASDGVNPYVLAILVGIAMLLLKTLVIDHIDSPLRTERFRTGYHQLDSAPQLNINNQLTFIGHQRGTSAQTPAGSSLRYELFWSARAPIREDYQIIVKLLTADGLRVAQVDDLAPAGIGTRNWLTGYYLLDTVDLPIPSDTPPGEYRIVVEVFSLSSQQTLPIINTVGNPDGVTIPLDRVVISPAEPAAAQPVLLAQSDSLGLVMTSGTNEVIGVGQPLELRLTWLALKDITGQDTVLLEWTQDGITHAQTDVSPHSGDDMPWPAGRVYTTRRLIYVPADLNSGEYIPILRWADVAFPLPPITITAPERLYQPPANMTPIADAEWTGGIRLIGYLFAENGSLALVWQANTPQNRPLRRFAHILSDDDTILHVTDGFPVSWSRPVTSWAVGEIIIDIIDTPPQHGQRVRVGWYHPIDGLRLPINTTDHYDFIPSILATDTP